jgi:SAM-dependent methyltransferase
MRRRGLDSVTPFFSRVLHKTRLASGVNVGDLIKSWDVLKTLKFIEENVSSTSPILDIGAYASEVLCSLHKMGFQNLTGIDLNPKLRQMPFAEFIKYVAGDFTRSSFPAETFAAITAISVVEHGFSSSDFFKEMSRLLRPGGYLIGSTDYWPEKIDTSGITIFGVDWKIFSQYELSDFIAEAANYGLSPVGDLDFEASEKIVNYFQRQYTFAWFALQKRTHA